MKDETEELSHRATQPNIFYRSCKGPQLDRAIIELTGSFLGQVALAVTVSLHANMLATAVNSVGLLHNFIKLSGRTENGNTNLLS